MPRLAKKTVTIRKPKKKVVRAGRGSLPRPLNLCGSNIRRLRLLKKNPSISQADLAKRVSAIIGIEIDQSAVARVENGTRIVPDYELRAFSKALKVSISDLLA